MPAEALIAEFHHAAARDLALYIAGLALLSLAAIATSVKISRRELLAFAFSLTTLSAALSAAALNYRSTIPDRIAADIAACAEDLAAAANTFEAKYGPREAGRRFSWLAAIWSSVFIIGMAAVKHCRYSVVRGVAASMAVLSAITFILDAAAFARDVRYSEKWRALQIDVKY